MIFATLLDLVMDGFLKISAIVYVWKGEYLHAGFMLGMSGMYSTSMALGHYLSKNWDKATKLAAEESGKEPNAS